MLNNVGLYIKDSCRYFNIALSEFNDQKDLTSEKKKIGEIIADIMMRAVDHEKGIKQTDFIEREFNKIDATMEDILQDVIDHVKVQLKDKYNKKSISIIFQKVLVVSGFAPNLLHQEVNKAVKQLILPELSYEDLISLSLTSSEGNKLADGALLAMAKKNEDFKVDEKAPFKEQCLAARQHLARQYTLRYELQLLNKNDVISNYNVVMSEGQIDVEKTLTQLKMMTAREYCHIFIDWTIYSPNVSNTLNFLLKNIPVSEKTEKSTVLRINFPLQINVNTDQAIHKAAELGHFGLAKLLLDFGARPDGDLELYHYSRIRSEYPITLAADADVSENQKLELIKLLVERGAIVRDFIKTGKPHTPIAVAIHNENKQIVDYLVKKGANLWEPSGDSIMDSSLYGACKASSSDYLELLYKGRPFDSSKVLIDSPSPTALFLASVENLKWLRNKGVDLFWENKKGESAFWYAAMVDDGKARMEYLLNINPSLNINKQAGNYNTTPLYQAICFNQTDVVKFLIERGADFTIKPDQVLYEELLKGLQQPANQGMYNLIKDHLPS